MALSAKDRLSKARIDLLTKHPFWGTLALRLRLVEMDDNMRAWFVSNGCIPTLAVDGKTMWYDPSYIDQLEYQHLLSACAHEVGHCMADHMGRRGSRIQGKWLRATDYMVNGMLKRCGFQIKEGWLIDDRFDDHMSAEMIYNLLDDDEEDKRGGGAQDLVLDADMEKDPELRDQWEMAVQQAAIAANQAGKLPAELARFIKELLEPTIDWKSQLRQFVTEVTRSDYSWTRPNKFFAHLGLVLPSLYSEQMAHMAVAVDDSGSIYQKILDVFGNETASAIAAARPREVTLISCDCRVNHVDEFNEYDPFTVESITTHGGGGTDFRPPFQWLEERGKRPSCMIYLTDGYGPFPEHAPDYPVLWCITTDVVPPWGQHLKITLD